MILERKKLLALADRWDKKARSAEARYQESGERRHLRDKENAEDIADALRMAANAEEDYSKLVQTRGRLAAYEATGMTPADITALAQQEADKHGQWLDDGDPLTWLCSKCGYYVERYNNTPYCPRCGRKMDGKEEHA